MILEHGLKLYIYIWKVNLELKIRKSVSILRKWFTKDWGWNNRQYLHPISTSSSVNQESSSRNGFCYTPVLANSGRTTWFNLKNLQVKSADKDSLYRASTWLRACIRIHDEVLQKTDTHIQCKLRTGTSKEHISKEKWVLIITSNRRNAYDSVLLFQNMPHRMAKMKPNVSNEEELNSQVQLMGETDSSICQPCVFGLCWNSIPRHLCIQSPKDWWKLSVVLPMTPSN